MERDTSNFVRVEIPAPDAEEIERLRWGQDYKGGPPAWMKEIRQAIKSANFDQIATRGHRGVSGEYLRKVMLARYQTANIDGETWWGAQQLAETPPVRGVGVSVARAPGKRGMRALTGAMSLFDNRSWDRGQVGRADAILREHGWLVEVGKVGRARKYRIAIGDTVTKGTQDCTC